MPRKWTIRCDIKTSDWPNGTTQQAYISAATAEGDPIKLKPLTNKLATKLVNHLVHLLSRWISLTFLTDWMTWAAPFTRHNTTEVLRTVTDHCLHSHPTGLSPSANTKQRPTLSHHSGRYKGRPSILQHQPPGLDGTRSTNRAGISS
jgi:hypothetical protein